MKNNAEINFLLSKKYINIFSSDNYSDLIFGNEDNFITATQGEKENKFAIAYFYTGNDGDSNVIDRTILKDIADKFKGSKIELFTNAGIDLHSSELNLFKNIAIKKTSYSNFNKIN